MEDAFGDKTSLRVASFSCYLDTNKENIVQRVSSQENLVFNVPNSTQDPPPAFTFSQETPTDAKISVFGAEKYFNMKMEIKPDSKKEGPIHPPSNTRPRTLSLRSESSGNSQTALLSNGSQTKQKKAVRRRFFNGFGCKVPCFGKKAIQVRKEIANTEDSRNSIEVFGSKTTTKCEIATNMERKLSMLTWDAIPKAQNLQTSTVGSGTVCDDMASEASSDLFEIENLSGLMYPTLTSDDMSICMTPTSEYAPSEASIQWSVVTASAADYSSVLSDNYNDDEMRRDKNDKNGSTKSRNGGILGCKSQKAVDVAENYVCNRSNEKGKNQGLDLSVSLGKSQACTRSKVKDIGSLELPRSFPLKNIEY